MCALWIWQSTSIDRQIIQTTQKKEEEEEKEEKEIQINQYTYRGSDRKKKKKRCERQWSIKQEEEEDLSSTKKVNNALAIAGEGAAQLNSSWLLHISSTSVNTVDSLKSCLNHVAEPQKKKKKKKVAGRGTWNGCYYRSAAGHGIGLACGTVRYGTVPYQF